MAPALRRTIHAAFLLLAAAVPAQARIKLVALPERGDTMIRLDNPAATLIEEERVLTLQKGLNRVDFAWQGVQIEPDSIQLRVLTHPDQVTLLNVSYPPSEAALVWEIHAAEAWEEQVRISYLLQGIDRLVTYKGVADTEETSLDLKSYLILRNFSGEDFEQAHVLLDYGKAFEQSINHEGTRQLLFMEAGKVPVEKVWIFDAAQLPWDPEQVDGNVGIPVRYRLENSTGNGLGRFALWGGKVRVYQDDGHGGTIFLGEDVSGTVPVGEKMEITIGDSRDLVITQRMMREEKINVRRNKQNRIVLHDTDELIQAHIENFKDKPAILTMIQHIPGEWEVAESSHEYQLKDASTLEFEIRLEPQSTQEFALHFQRRNVR